MLSDAATDAGEKKAVIDAVFAKSLGVPALKLLTVAASDRWSSDDDLLGGIEDKTVPPANPAKRLVIEGYAIMGGVEVKN